MMEIEAVLEKMGLTEFERPSSGPMPHINRWCQSGAQAGWGPDIEEVRVEERGKRVEILNDLYTPRVMQTAKLLRDLGCKVTLTFEPKGAAMLSNLGLTPLMVAAAEKGE